MNYICKESQASKSLFIACAALLLLASLFVDTHAQSNGPNPPKPGDEPSPAQKYFTDVVLVNQDGKEMRLYSDLLKGNVVIINAMFTSCNGVCPPMSRNMEMIQERLGDRLGKGVQLLSFSVDPAVDTPPVLKQYARRFHAKPGWQFLTGKRENLEVALRKLGQYVEVREDHTNIFIIGNERTGLWKKAFGLANPQELIKVVESVLNDDGKY